MSDTWVMTEDEALELLAFLVTAARTQVDEPHEYGPLRLLSAANRLGDVIRERASSATRQLVAGPLKQMPQTAALMADRAGYTAQVDALCGAVANHLVAHFGLERSV